MSTKFQNSFLKIARFLRNSGLVTNKQYCSSSATGVIGVTTSKTLAESDSEDARSIKSYKQEVNGVNLSYEKTGVGKNVVLLMPGAIGSSRTDFLLQLENMQKDLFTLIGWHPRGYGYSRPPERDWPLDFFRRDADDAAELMKKLNIPRYSVLGWSDGGITGMVLAARNPEAVSKLVVWGANCFVTKEEVESYENIRDTSSWSARMRQPFVDMYGEELFQKLWGDWATAISRYYYARNGDICQKEVQQIQCPTLIVHGEKDALVPDFHPKYLKENIKNSRLVNYPDGKHNLHMKYYKEFNSLVEQFLLEQNTE